MNVILFNKYCAAISSLNLFSSLSEEDLREIFSSSQFEIKEYGKEEIIHLQNEICTTMDIILTGQAAVRNIDENGKVLTVSVFSASDYLGANLIFSSRNYYPMTIVSITNTVVLHMNKGLILELSRKSSGFTVSLLTAVSDRSLILTDKLNAISLKTIRQRIIEYLRFEHYIQKSLVIKLTLSKKDLAERLGIPRSSLGRELKKMRNDGLLQYDAKTISVCDNTFLDA